MVQAVVVPGGGVPGGGSAIACGGGCGYYPYYPYYPYGSAYDRTRLGGENHFELKLC